LHEDFAKVFLFFGAWAGRAIWIALGIDGYVV
jgi:hypothetical protein